MICDLEELRDHGTHEDDVADGSVQCAEPCELPQVGSTSVGSTSILSPNFGTAGCQTLSTATSTAIVANGESYRVVQFALKFLF